MTIVSDKYILEVLERALFSVSELAKNIGDHGDDRKI
jgi:hypothetical protein